jgi:hypothetical protein
LAAAASAVVAATAIAGSTYLDLATSNLNTPAGHTTALTAGATYQASAFPIGLRLTPSDGTWSGSQWTTSSHGKPTFGWAAAAHGGISATTPPRGVVQIVTAFGSTPSVAATVARLQAGGSGTNYQKASRVTLAGYRGIRLDGNVWGRFGHTFIPFSSKTNGASPADSFKAEKGETFRFVVVDVHHKTVVFFYDSIKLTPNQFADFLTSANRLLASLRFGA